MVGCGGISHAHARAAQSLGGKLPESIAADYRSYLQPHRTG